MRVVSSSVGTIRVSPSVQSTNMGLSKKHTVLLGYNITIAVCGAHTLVSIGLRSGSSCAYGPSDDEIC